MAHFYMEETLVMDYSLIDWKLLWQQKSRLLSIIASMETRLVTDPERAKVAGVQEDIDALMGLLHAVDFIQDSAVDDGLPEEMVFYYMESVIEEMNRCTSA